MTKQEEKHLNLKRRLEYTLWVDRDFDGTWPLVGILVKYGGFGYNCFRSEKPLWWVSKVKEED